MSVAGEYVAHPEELEILKELESISNKEISNFQFMQVIKNLNSTFPHVKVKCLELIGLHIDPLSNFPCGTSKVFEIVQWYTHDHDARVRQTAFALYLEWLERGFVLPDLILVFDLLQIGLNDYEEDVVIKCLQLVVKMANLQPDADIFASKQKARLADRSFCSVAYAMSHASSSVRRSAATLMRAIDGVSESLMLETLEKTVMKDKIIKKSVSDRTIALNKLYWIDEDASGNKWGQMNQCDSAEEAMAMGGINGALICGLEDDFYEIRLEAIRTVGQLALRSDKFAVSCQDLLVDMLTDDIDVVRSGSVANLGLASGRRANMTLRTDQLDIVLSMLAERSGNMRRSIHGLLGSCRLASAHALRRLVDGLLANLRQYESDRDSIWRCAARVGSNHAELVQLNINSLLQIHPYLVSQEPNKSDAAYITVLLMVINASRRLPSIAASFPNHVRTNEIYLKELVPDLICDVNQNDMIDDPPPTKRMKLDESENSPRASVPRQDLYVYLVDTIRTLYELLFRGCDQASLDDKCLDTVTTNYVSFKSGGGAGNLMRLLLQDLRQISVLCTETRGVCLWLRDLGQLARLTQQMPMSLMRLQEGRYLARKMINVYTGVSQPDIDLLTAFIGDIDNKIKCIEDQYIMPTRETMDILSTPPAISSLKSLSILSCIGSNASLDLIHSSLSAVIQVTAKQLFPTANDTERSAHKFCSGMSLRLSVRAEFTGLDFTIDQMGHIVINTPVAVVVNRPDGMVFHWQPPNHCWTSANKQMNPFDPKKILFLDTEVPLSFSEWSESGQVQLGLAIMLSDKELTWKLTDPVGVKIFPISANKCL